MHVERSAEKMVAQDVAQNVRRSAKESYHIDRGRRSGERCATSRFAGTVIDSAFT